MANTIDERVVVLKFDNGQFEDATKTSMTTLEKLKQSLKMDKANDGFANLSKSVKSFSLGGISTAIETINKRFSTMGIAGMTVISNLTTAAMGMAKKIVTAIPSQVIHGGWTRALNIENAKFQIEGLGKTWEEFADDINYAVADTAYGLDAAAMACSQLAASGVEAGDDMKAALRGISGVAAMTNSSYEDISRVFTTVAGNGRVMGDQLLQLSSRGLNAAAKMADAFNELGWTAGATEQDIREMVKHGEIDFYSFATAMDYAFGEHAKEANKTFTGALSNVKAALSKIGADVAEVQLFNLRNILNEVRIGFNAARYALQPFIIALNKVSIAASGPVVKGLQLINKALEPFAERGKKLKADWDVELAGIKAAWDQDAEEISKTAEKASKKAAKAVDEVAHALDKDGKVIKVTAEEAQAAWDIWQHNPYGSGKDRVKNLEAVGLEYKFVQAYVNDLKNANWDLSKTTIEVAEANEKVAKASEKKEKAEKKASKAANESTRVAKEQTKHAIKASKETTKMRRNYVAMYDFVGEFGKKQGKAIKEANEGTKTTKRNYELICDALAEYENKLTTIQKVQLTVSNIGVGIKNIATSVVRVVSPIFSAIKGGLKSFGGSLVNPLMTASYMFSQFTSKLIITEKAQKKVKKAVAETLKTFGAFGLVLKELGSVLWTIVSAPFKLFASEFEKSKQTTEKSGSALETYLNILNKLNEFWGKRQERLAGFKEWLVTNERIARAGQVLVSVFKKLGSIIKGFFISVKNFFAGLKNLEGVQHLGEAFKNLGQAMKKAIGAGVDKVLDKLEKFAGLEFKNPSLNKFSDFISKAADSLANFINALANGENPLKKFFELLRSFNIGGKFASIAEGAKNAGENIKEFFAPLANLKIGTVDFSGILPNGNQVMVKIANFFHYFSEKIDWTDTLGSVTKFLRVLRGFKLASGFSSMMTGLGRMFWGLGDVGIAIKRFSAEYIRQMRFKLLVNALKTLAISVALIAGSLYIVSIIKPSRLHKSITVIAGVIAGLLGIVALIQYAKIDMVILKNFSRAMALFGVGMMLITASIAIISRMKPERIIKGGTVITGFVFMMVGAMRVAKKGEVTGFAKLAAAVLLLTVSMVVLSKIKPAKLIKAGTAIGALILMLTLALKQTKFYGKDSTSGVVKMAAAVLMLTGALVVLSKLKPAKLAKGIVAIGLVIAELVIAMRSTKSIGDGGVKTLRSMALVIGVVAGSLAVLSLLKPGRLVASSAALLATMITVLALCKSANKGKRASMAGVLAIVLVIGSITGALMLLSLMDLKGMLAATIGLSAVILSLTLAVAVLKRCQWSDLPGVLAGIVAMEAVLWALIGTFVLIDKLSKATGYDIAERIGEMIGKFVGGILKGIGNAALDLLISLAATLEVITPQLEPFFKMLSNMPGNALESAKDLALALSALTSAELKSALKNFIFGGSTSAGIDSMADTMSKLAEAMKTYYDKLAGVKDWKNVKSATKAMKDIVELWNEMPRLKGHSMDVFLYSVPKLAEGVASAGKKLTDSGFENLSATDIKNFKRFVFVISDVWNDLPRVKGNAINVFVSRVKPFSKAVAGGMDVLSSVTIDMAAVSAMRKFTAVIAKTWNDLPRVKENALSVFVSHLKPFSQAVADGMATLSVVTTSPAAVIAMRKFTASVAKTWNDLPRFKVRTLNKFINHLPDFAAGVANGMASLNGTNFNLAQIEGFKQMGEAAASIMAAAAEESNTTWAMDQLPNYLPQLAKAGVAAMAALNTVQFNPAAINSFGSLLDVFEKHISLMEMLPSLAVDMGVDGPAFTTAMTDIGGGVSGLMAAIKNTPFDDEKIRQFAALVTALSGIQNYLSFEGWDDSLMNGDRLSGLSEQISKFAENMATTNTVDYAGAQTKIEMFVETCNTLAGINEAGLKLLTSYMTTLGSLGANVKSFFDAIGGVDTSSASSAFSAFSDFAVQVDYSKFEESGADAMASFCKGITEHSGDPSSAFVTAVTTIADSLQYINNFEIQGSDAVDSYCSGISLGYNTLIQKGSQLVEWVIDGIETMSLYSAGRNLVAGFARGISEASDVAKIAARKMAADAITAAENRLNINSPSKEFMRIGGSVVEGFSKGIRINERESNRASKKMAINSIKNVEDAISSISQLASQDLEYEPTIKPVVDFSNIRGSANRIDSLLAGTRNMGFAISGNVAAQLQNRSDLEGSLAKLSSRLDRVTDSMNSREMVNYITVDGAENPELFADRFVRRLKLNMRTV